jgi:hypothetical protein
MVYNLKVTILVAVLSLLCGSVYSINNSIAIAQPTYSITVSKTSISDFTVTNGGSYTGSFDTTYTMRGSEIEFEATRDLLISSIVSDFDKSPTIGYIKIHNNDNQSSGNKTGLPNPFAGQDQINKKISSVLSNALDNIIHPAPGITLASGPNFRQIKCEFGDVLSDFRCDVTPVLLK